MTCEPLTHSETMREYCDRLERALLLTQKRLRAGGWQPIETAPKITDVLCLLESGRASVMYLTDNGQGFMDNWRNPDGTASGHWPTHWMPLPQPPQGETT